METAERTSVFAPIWRSHGAAIAPLALAFLASAIYLFGLGDLALLDYDEAAYGEVVRQTLESGDMLTLKSGDAPWFDKPPLFYWLAMLSVKLFGLTELALRLPSALAGIATVLATYSIAKLATGSPGWSFMAGYVLLSTAAFLDASRQGRIDTLVTFFLVSAVYAFLRARRDGRWNFALGASIGLAVMAKGVIGLLAYPLILIAAAGIGRFEWLRKRDFWLGQGIALLVALPWHLYETFAYGAGFWKTYLIVHVVTRYGENLLGNDVSVMTYVDYLYYFASPWFLLFLCLLFVLWYVRGRLAPAVIRPLLPPLASMVFLFVLFASAETKIPYYLVPMYPFMALFIAYSLRVVWEIPARSVARSVAAVAVGAMMATGLFGAIDLGYHRDPAFNIEQRLAGDERDIGLRLRDSYPGLSVRFVDDIYWETVRFYSRGREVSLFDESARDTREFLLVVPTWKSRHDELVRDIAGSSSVEYQGEYFTLLLVPAGAVPPVSGRSS